METVGSWIALIGWVLSFCGTFAVVAATFQRSVGWGFAALILFPVLLVAIFKYWPDTRNPTLVGLAGVAIFVVGTLLGRSTPGVL